MPSIEPTRTPFFVVGTGRSGTTMFRNLLRVHPDVFVPRETHWLPILWNEFGATDASTDRMQALVDRVTMAKGRTSFERIMLEQGIEGDELRRELRAALGTTTTIERYHRTFLQTIAQRCGRSTLGDKTPDYGLCMGVLRTIFPGARFVHISRDGRDVALSMSRVLSFRILAALDLTHWWSVAIDHQYERGLAKAAEAISPDVFFELWHRRIRRIRDEASRLATSSFLELRYEDLLADPAARLRDVHSFLGLPGGDAWTRDAASLVRSENRDRNAGSSDRTALGHTHAEALEELGFAP